MNLDNNKNKEFILKFIELNELIKGRDNAQVKCKEMITNLTDKKNNSIELVNYALKTNNDINELKIEYEIKPKRLRQQLGYFEAVKSVDKLIDNIKLNVEIDGYLNNSLQIKYINIKSEIEKGFLTIRDRVSEETSNILRDKPHEICEEKFDCFCKIIYKNENYKTIKLFEELIEPIIKELNDYDYKPIVLDEIKNRENTLAIINKELGQITKEYFSEAVGELVSMQKSNYLNCIEESKDNKIKQCEIMIKNLTSDIEKAFVSTIPKKYIFDKNFREYAIEAFYYERVQTIGELLNAYENYEVHQLINSSILESIEMLNIIEYNQFKELMELKDINLGISQLGSEIADISYELGDLNGTIGDGFNHMGKHIIQGQIVSQQMNRNILEANYEIANKANSLAISNIDALNSIGEESRRIGKDIYKIKEFTDKYSKAKALEGKYYY